MQACGHARARACACVRACVRVCVCVCASVRGVIVGSVDRWMGCLGDCVRLYAGV